MKTLALVTTISLAMLSLQAQDQFPDYGILKTDEIAMKECPFDPEANAVILSRDARADHDEQNKLITLHRVRLKILKEKGIEHGNIRIVYYTRDGFESIDLIQGKIFQQNGAGGMNFTELERKSIYRKEINKYYSEVVFAFPNVKPGSIIEYTYRSTMTHYGGLDDWEFQQSLPVVKSSFSLVIVPNYEFAYRVQKREDYPIKVETTRGSGRIFFEMNNIPGLQSEPYMDARKDYVQRVVFQLSGYNGYFAKKYSTSWTELVRELYQHQSFGVQLGKNLSGSDELIARANSEPTTTAKINLIYNFVKNTFTSNGFTGIYSSDGLKTVWTKRTGHSGEINLLLVNLLKEAGVDAHPLVVSERGHGRVNPQYPFLEQFNTVYAYAIADGRKFYLNALDRYNPPHIVPYKILNTTGLLVTRRDGGLIEIKDDQFEYRDYINVTGSVTPDGFIKGRVFVSSSDYARSARLAAYRDDPHKYVEKFSGKGGVIKLDSFDLLNEDVDSLPLQSKFNFSTALNNTGDYMLLPTYLFSGSESNPFISKIRFSNINFGFRQTVNLNYYLHVEEGVKPEDLPKTVRMVNPDKTIVFSRLVAYDEKTRQLVSRITITNTKSQFDLEEYPAVHEFYKKMSDYLNEQIVIKKS